MSKKINLKRDGYHSVNVYIVVRDAAKAIQFYKDAFGAKEQKRYDMPNGKIMYAEILIGDSIVLLSDEFPDSECDVLSPHSLKASSCMLHLSVDDADNVFEMAVKAGAKIKRSLENMFWGDRYGQVEDPFGHLWSIATRIENVSPEEIKKRAMQLFS